MARSRATGKIQSIEMMSATEFMERYNSLTDIQLEFIHKIIGECEKSRSSQDLLARLVALNKEIHAQVPEIEVRNFDELQQVLDLGGVDRIMFDNFTPEMTKKAVEMVAGKYETESSGGITFDTLRDYAECGVAFISVGALTHSVKGLDMSFKAC